MIRSKTDSKESDYTTEYSTICQVDTHVLLDVFVAYIKKALVSNIQAKPPSESLSGRLFY